MQIRDRIKAFRRVEARQLRNNPNNWRRHSEAQRSALRGLLERLGYVGALIARETKRGKLELLDGHLRAELTPTAKVPVLIVDLSDAEAAEVLATFDPLGAMAETDAAALAKLLASCEIEDANLRDALQQIIDDAPPLEPEAGLVDPDDIPEPPTVATTKPGDLWTLGDHRLLCGDSAKLADVKRLLGGLPVHLLNTDPPYNVKLEPRSNNAIAAGLRGRNTARHQQQADLTRHPEKAKGTTRRLRPKDRPLENDHLSNQEFDARLRDWFGNAAAVLLPGRAFYIWGGYANCANYPPAMKAAELYFSQAIIWVKGHPVLTRKDFLGNHEWCFYGWREGAAHRFFGPANAVDVWEIQKVNPQSMVHLTEKPVELAARAIEYSSRPREHVLDLFGGSGSTLIACEQFGRRAFLCEIDALYCDVIVQRWEQFTGKKARRRNFGRNDAPRG